MSLNFFNVVDALQVWDNVKDSVKASIAVTKNRDTRDLDYSFITPTLLALGKFAEPKIEELLEVLQGNPVIIWNLSGKSLTPDGTAKLRNQIIDAPWVTPGQFTQAPSLDCIFSQCYSIKSWLDLRSDHVAIVHCSNGRSRSGILIACLLKYIGAFDHASQAFDFFCSARVQCDVKPTLAPSYRILFENVDKTVDSGGYPNRHPVHLKCLAISGLPVDEIPCVEVWDMHGLVFNSHAGWKSTSKCTWSSEYGDGFFRVSHDILGDFSVMCRFGGHHAMTRDKTTLIFKYQNNTAFLPCEVVELKRQNVDINPEYSDSLDSELFTVHLMFEKPSAETALAAAAEAQRVGTELSNSSAGTVQYSAESDFGRSNSVLPTYVSYSSINGGQAFDRGLEEISKYHFLEPEPQKITALTDMGFPEKFATSALRLANNNLDQAAVLVQNMTARASDLEKGVVESVSSSSTPPTLTTSTSSMSLSLSYNATGPAVMASQSKLHKSQSLDASFESDTLISDALDPVLSPRGDENKREIVEIEEPPPSPLVCCVCGENDPAKQDQLLPCTSCRGQTHTVCDGLRRIPFTLKTDKERQNREKYIRKHYSQYHCKDCKAEMAIAKAKTGTRTNSNQTSSGAHPVRSAAERPLSTNMSRPLSTNISRSSKPTTAVPAQPSSSSTYRPSSSSSSSSGAVSSSTSPDNSGAGAGANWMSPSQHTRSVQPHPQSPVPAHVQTKHDQAAALMGLLAASGLTMDSLFAMGEEKQREALIAAATKNNSSRHSDPSTGATGTNGNSKSSGGSGNASISGTVTEKNGSDHRSTSDSGSGTTNSETSSSSSSVPAPPKAVAADPRKAMMEMLAKRSKAASGESAEEAPPAPPAASSSVAAPASKGTGGVKLKDDPKYSKYFKMIKVGLPKPAVAQKMFSEGVVTSIDAGLELLAQDPEVAAPAPGGSSGPSAGTGSGSGKSDDKVAIKDHPQYSKYFKMLKVGLPIDAVKAKMQQEGINSDYIDKDPDALISLTEPKNGADDGSNAAAGGGDVAISDHPKYGKYFRMLKVGLPREAIKAKMQHEGMNPSYLDKDPSEVIPIDSGDDNGAAGGAGGGGSSNEAKVAVADHPAYAKYFKMMKVGLPKEAIKAKMQQEGVNPSYLDKDPTELVPLVESKTPSGGDAAAVTRPKGPNPALALIAGNAAALSSGGGGKNIPKLRKKKLYWKALDASQVGRDSLWADKDDDITLDEAEFNQLFVESNDDLKKPQGEVRAAAGPLVSRKRVNLIDMKRGQNAGIALARIKMSFAEVKERISLMDDEIFTTDQLRSLSDYLPSAEEAALIKAFRGDPEMLGQAEKYMKVMTGFNSAAKRIQVMIYKQQFKGRVGECCGTLSAIENACDDVKMSVRLKKVLKTILKVGNQMNDGEDHLGFTLDSLLKLQSAKAFDKKTSILQYVIMLIYRNDEKCLAFPDELSHCAEASRLTLDSAQQEQMALRQGLEASLRVITEIKAEDSAKQVANSSTTMACFLVKARQSLEELDHKIENVRNKFANVLAYFGEEKAMASQDFFSTLTKFVQEFIAARDNLDRQRRVEMKKTAREKEQKERQRVKDKDVPAVEPKRS